MPRYPYKFGPHGACPDCGSAIHECECPSEEDYWESERARTRRLRERQRRVTRRNYGYRRNRQALNMDYGREMSSSREGKMLKRQLVSMQREAGRLHSLLEDGDDLPGWVQGKITTGLDRLTTARQYIEGKLATMGYSLPDTIQGAQYMMETVVQNPHYSPMSEWSDWEE